MPSGKQKYLAVAFAGAAAIFGGVLFFNNPSTSEIFPPCPTQYLTGYYCPGCGSLRALHALLHGDLAAAFSQNALTVVSIPFLVLLFLFPGKFQHPAVPWTILALLLIFTVVRNTGWGACLAPF